MSNSETKEKSLARKLAIEMIVSAVFTPSKFLNSLKNSTVIHYSDDADLGQFKQQLIERLGKNVKKHLRQINEYTYGPNSLTEALQCVTSLPDEILQWKFVYFGLDVLHENPLLIAGSTNQRIKVICTYVILLLMRFFGLSHQSGRKQNTLVDFRWIGESRGRYGHGGAVWKIKGKGEDGKLSTIDFEVFIYQFFNLDMLSMMLHTSSMVSIESVCSEIVQIITDNATIDQTTYIIPHIINNFYRGDLSCRDRDFFGRNNQLKSRIDFMFQLIFNAGLNPNLIKIRTLRGITDSACVCQSNYRNDDQCMFQKIDGNYYCRNREHKCKDHFGEVGAHMSFLYFFCNTFWPSVGTRTEFGDVKKDLDIEDQIDKLPYLNLLVRLIKKGAIFYPNERENSMKQLIPIPQIQQFFNRDRRLYSLKSLIIDQLHINPKFPKIPKKFPVALYLYPTFSLNGSLKRKTYFTTC